MDSMLWRITAPLLLIAGTLCGVEEARAWGPEGHAIVAEIAEARLSGPASAQVAQLLNQEQHQHLDEVSSWADDYRESHPETGPWHFVDIPLPVSSYDPDRDCGGGNCVVVQIQKFAAVLGNKNVAPADRLIALKFVVHFVGDIHQPLHCEDNGDRGGNSIHLSYFKRSTNFHAVWDGGIIEQALGVRLGPHFAPDLAATRQEAAALGSNISASDAATWAPSGLVAQLSAATVDWANASHTLAQMAYQNLPSTPRPRGWDQTYQGEEWPVIQDQLTRAGVRLAELLNEELQ
jgi:hypothetical protein